MMPGGRFPCHLILNVLESFVLFCYLIRALLLLSLVVDAILTVHLETALPPMHHQTAFWKETRSFVFVIGCFIRHM